MPKEITHWMVAERALALLPEGSALRRTLVRHRQAYLGGAVLPDTLLHVLRGPFHPTARNLGQGFHDQAGNSYAPLVLAERRFPDGIPPPLLAALLGVICHVEADATLHPYVYAATGSGCIGEHYRLETAIDVHFLRRGFEPAHRRLDRLLCPETRQVLVNAAGHLFDPEAKLPRQALEHALEQHCRCQAMYDRVFWKVAVRVLGRVCGAPYKQQRHLFYPVRRWKAMAIGAGKGGAWRHPESGELRGESVDELAQQAVERTAAVFCRIEKARSLAAALETPPGANLLTGLHGVIKGKSS